MSRQWQECRQLVVKGCQHCQEGAKRPGGVERVSVSTVQETVSLFHEFIYYFPTKIQLFPTTKTRSLFLP
jgi:hypothetical protein